MADVFISYARVDRPTAEALASAFAKRGWSVWFDRHIEVSESWDVVIERELKDARCVVVLWSEAAVLSTFVRNEARRALTKLAPARIESVSLPVEFDHVQTADLMGWDANTDHSGFIDLSAGVARVLTGKHVDGQARVAHKSIWTRRNWQYAALGSLLISTVVGIAYYETRPMPRVLLMDSPLPQVVYDKEAAAKGQTNASTISDILKDLPVVTVKEATDLEWHREEEIRRMNPELILIHGSAFYSATNASDNAGKLISFLEYMKNSHSRFLIYTRVPAESMERVVTQRIPSLHGRVRTWQVPGGPAASFSDPATRRTVKQMVSEMLGI